MELGVDLSDYNYVESFHEVAESGVKFVVCKATQGIDNTQATFAPYQSRIRSVPGLAFGAYHFFEWGVDAVAQAEHFLSVYKPQSGDLPPMIDCEAFSVSADVATAQISAFIDAVEKHLNGHRMLIYTDWDSINTQAFVTDDFSGHPLWLAQYSDSWNVPNTWNAPTIWQYSDQGLFPGIEGDVDCDRYLGDDFSGLLLKL